MRRIFANWKLQLADTANEILRVYRIAKTALSVRIDGNGDGGGIAVITQRHHTSVSTRPMVEVTVGQSSSDGGPVRIEYGQLF
jgi:hypothetical protein